MGGQTIKELYTTVTYHPGTSIANQMGVGVKPADWFTDPHDMHANVHLLNDQKYDASSINPFPATSKT